MAPTLRNCCPGNWADTDANVSARNLSSMETITTFNPCAHGKKTENHVQLEANFLVSFPPSGLATFFPECAVHVNNNSKSAHAGHVLYAPCVRLKKKKWRSDCTPFVFVFCVFLNDTRCHCHTVYTPASSPPHAELDPPLPNSVLGNLLRTCIKPLKSTPS